MRHDDIDDDDDGSDDILYMCTLHYTHLSIQSLHLYPHHFLVFFTEDGLTDAFAVPFAAVSILVLAFIFVEAVEVT